MKWKKEETGKSPWILRIRFLLFLSSVLGKASLHVLRFQKTTFAGLCSPSFSVTSPCPLCPLWFSRMQLTGVRNEDLSMETPFAAKSSGKREHQNLLSLVDTSRSRW
ncbi:MAG: hypothetical protein D6679_06200 [Candidatus Hydrogenedentota bacterium]|nr:MAG: hypothetical protein D6679_06200 [Candidatus Hydrogenedentota bacterium]